jgi:hypothetical protein
LIRREHNTRRWGFAVQAFLFILAVVGITATTTLSIWEAYQKFIVEPRTPGELERLRRENSELRQEANALRRETHLFEAAEAIERDRLSGPRAAKGAGLPRLQVPDEIRFRGMSSEEIALRRHQERVDSAVAIVAGALSDPHSLPVWLHANDIAKLRADMAAVENEEHPSPPFKPGDRDIEEAEHPGK